MFLCCCHLRMNVEEQAPLACPWSASQETCCLSHKSKCQRLELKIDLLIPMPRDGQLALSWRPRRGFVVEIIRQSAYCFWLFKFIVARYHVAGRRSDFVKFRANPVKGVYNLTSPKALWTGRIVATLD